MPMTRARFARCVLPGMLALGLLLLSLHWMIPMMLRDHLDLVPILQAWQRGDLADSGFLRMHGGHLHTAAYAVLLATTTLSGGQPWLDGVVSWLFLLACAAIVLTFAREAFPDGSRRDTGFIALIAFLALFPGHLANLQWGWQVAVFLCLTGVALTNCALAALFAIANALHMMRKAAHVSAQSHAIATTIRATWPQVDRDLLGEIHFDQPDVAARRLQGLHAMGFPPFDKPPAGAVP